MNANYSIPHDGIKGLKENWRSDLLAAVSVSLVALPLALGIAVASGVSPMAGILSAIIGGVVTTFFRGGHLAINGPAAGLIAVILGGLVALEGNINYVLAAIVVSGGIQAVLGADWAPIGCILAICWLLLECPWHLKLIRSGPACNIVIRQL